jgi:hypothetical protein
LGGAREEWRCERQRRRAERTSDVRDESAQFAGDDFVAGERRWPRVGAAAGGARRSRVAARCRRGRVLRGDPALRWRRL